MIDRMRKIKFLFVVVAAFVSLSLPLDVYAGESAADFIGRVAGQLKRAGGLSARFSMSSPRGSASGTITAQGNKFCVSTQASSVWFDGKSMWVLNPATQETTLTYPTAEELQEANPLQLASMAPHFFVNWGKSTDTSVKAVVLRPKSKKMGLKQVVMTVSPKTMLPVSIIIDPASGGRIKVKVSGVATGKNYPASTFTYPANKYPAYRLVDLR